LGGGVKVDILTLKKSQQYSDAKINQVVDFVTNVYNKNSPDSIVDGYYYGTIFYTSPTAGMSHKIPVKVGDTIRLFRDGNVNDLAAYSLFDENDNCIDNGNTTTIDNYREGTITNPAVAYIRVYVSHVRKDVMMVVINRSYPSEYIPFQTPKKTLREEIAFSDEHIVTIQKLLNPLWGKTALFTGDSICAGSLVGGNSWAKRIAEANNMTFVNYGVDGASIAIKDGRPKHIVNDIDNMQTDADYVIFEGGINDAYTNVPIGTLTDGYDDDYDKTTFAGALESIFKQSVLKWSGKKIGFIIPHKVSDMVIDRQPPYVNMTIEACHKWSIPYINLFNQSGLQTHEPTIRATFTLNSDGCHPNTQGYDIITPKIEAWMKTL
jgi:lysophospholipase L1-like esterase